MAGFRYEQYESPHTGAIASLLGRSPQAEGLLRGADAMARAQERRGLVNQQTFGAIGNAIGQAGQQVGQYMADAPQREQQEREQQNEAWLMQRIQSGEPPTPEELIGRFGSQRGMTLAKDFQALEANDLKDEASTRSRLAQHLRWIKALPQGMRANAWQGIRQQWTAAGVPANILPEQYQDEMADAALVWAGEKPAETKTRSVTVTNPDGSKTEQIVPDTPGQTFTSAAPPQDSAKTPELGSFADYVTRVAAEKGRRPDQLSVSEIRQARKDYQQADDRPFRDPVSVVIQGPAGPQLLDRKTNTATPVMGPDGKPLGQAPTAEMRNTAEGKKRLQPLLDSVEELTERINVNQGVYAKMAGGTAKVAAKLNLDDDVAEYESMVQAFTPIWARALGHVGVLTQQDVDSAKAALPRPGDSKSLRDRKIARIHKILGTQTNVDDGASPGMGITYQDYLKAKKKPGGG